VLTVLQHAHQRQELFPQPPVLFQHSVQVFFQMPQLRFRDLDPLVACLDDPYHLGQVILRRRCFLRSCVRS
jgi:hypothetical protein